MSRRTVILGLLAIWGVFAAAGFRSCGGQGPKSPELASKPVLGSADPSEATQAYWLAARQVSIHSAQSTIKSAEVQRRAGTIKSSADAERVWAELAGEYSRSAEVNADAVRDLKSLPAERVDPVAVECVTELGDLLALRADLFQKSGEDCRDMAALFAMVRAEGEGFDWSGPKGKAYERREAVLTARMKETAANEGAAEKRRLAELAGKARRAG